MKYLKALFRPVTAATIALGTMVFVSGCDTTSGMPELTSEPQAAPRDTRSAAPKAPAAPKAAAAQAAATTEETMPRCNPAPVPGVRPKPGCDY